MKKIFVCMALMVMGTRIVLAQSNFVPGIVITQQNDSLRGLVNFKNWTTNPGEIQFKTDEQSTIVLYKATAINGFVIPQQDVIYSSKHFLADVTFYQTLSMQAIRPAVELLDTTLFLRQLVKGEYALYAYTDIHERAHYLYEAPGRAVTELVYIKAMLPGEEGQRMYEKKLYQEQLDTLFHDHPKLARQNHSLMYYEKNMIAAFVKYNNFKNPSEKLVAKKVIYNPIWFGVVGGAAFYKYKFKGNYFLNIDYESSVNPIGGLFIDVPFGGPLRKNSFYGELLYKTMNTSGVLDKATNNVLNWNFSYVQVNIMYQYTYPKGLIKPFVHAGIGNAFMVREVKNEQVSSSGARAKVEDLRKLEQLAILGIGGRWSRFQLEGRVSTSTGWLPYNHMRIAANSFQLIGSYRF